MGRAQVQVRAAHVGDVPLLAELWSELLRTGDGVALGDLVALVEQQETDPDLRVLVAEIDSAPVGALLVRVCAVNPVNPDRIVQAFAPQVVASSRRRGVGTALVEAAVTFAEERGINYVGAAALSSSRDANRFFARIGLGPRAVLRIATTSAVRQRLGSVRPARGADRRHVDRVLAARRGRRSRVPS
ncbi:GNAT family N-acetyltransferase [Nocardioides yefusunii]|uniref:GNAT family N-acetyltransferase n=1 Tax=Nocardioides yefusunii TaxID=2500546 RepID=A0ABW1QWN9_9ACTN|nr:GNAT family N-acetyltransferase [Nocardioides yefusunii]